jgi:hypothetical protein
MKYDVFAVVRIRVAARTQSIAEHKALDILDDMEFSGRAIEVGTILREDNPVSVPVIKGSPTTGRGSTKYAANIFPLPSSKKENSVARHAARKRDRC